MYLERILGTKTKVNVLAVLIENPGRTFVEKELARQCGASLSEVNRQMRDLANSGLVTAQRAARDKTYQINKRHFLYKPLRSLFRDLVRIYRQAAQDLVSFATKHHRISCVLLLGSLVHHRIRSDIVEAPSDIDIAFVVPTKSSVDSLRQPLVEFINSEIGLRYGIAIYPIVLSVQEYRERVLSDPFFIRIHGEAEVIYGSKPRRARQVGSRKS